MAVDPTGAETAGDDVLRASLASVGCHLLMLAVHQQIITLDDLNGLALGQPFTVQELVAKRDTAAAARVGDMCVSKCYS